MPARPRTGPKINPGSRERIKEAGLWKRLPATCTKPAPQWPDVFGQPSDAIRAKWAELWAYPQAYVWREHKQEDLVATYVLMLMQVADYGESCPSNLITSLRQMADTIALSMSSLNSLRYVIEGSDEDVRLASVIGIVSKAKVGGDDVDAVKSRFKITAPVSDAE